MDKFVKTIGANRGGSDEWYTPKGAVKAIYKHIKPNSIIWCPFDTKDSNFVKLGNQKGHKIINTHISEGGKDFLKANVKSHIDYIISNPPYSIRNKVYAKLFELNIPFAMLYNSNGLFDSKLRTELAQEYGVELLYLYPRVSFIDSQGKRNATPFQSVYLCHNVLPEKIMFEVVGSRKEWGS